MLTERSSLTANGAATQDILMRSGAVLNLNGSTVSAGSASGITMESGALARISGSTITSGARGLVAARIGEVGSSAEVLNSKIIGQAGGASVASNSQLRLQGSLLQGSGATSSALRLFNGTFEAVDSTLVGGQEGILVNGDTVGDQAEINLQGTSVEGQNGAAIVVAGTRSGAAAAQIRVGAGSTLTGSNGNLLEVRNDSSAKLNVEGAHLVGNVVVEQGSQADLTLDQQATLTGQLENVASLAINNQSRWVMVADASVGDLAMNDGVVQFGGADAYQRLTLGNLSGNGTFVMDADFSTGQTDFLEVTGNATGSHSLLVGSSGADPSAENALHVISAAAGDADFSLLNGPVDLGAFSYELIQRGNDWFLDGSRKVISPGTQSVMALFNTAPTVWYGELSTLRSRMGELRMDDGKAGGWMRAYGNKYDVSASSGVAYKQVQRGLSFGADAPLPVGDGQWLVGVMAGYSRSDLDLTQGTSGEVDSYYLGAYTTWLDQQSGYYFDGVLKFNRFDNDSEVALSDGKRTKGHYSNHGVGASAEFGRHIQLADDYFIEPYTQWSMVHIQGKDYQLDNGLRGEGDATRSLLGKLGATAGRNFDLGEGRTAQPYVRAAVVHEFVNNNRVQVNDNRFNNDLSGSRGELGGGIAVSLMDRLQLHADFDYGRGEHIEQPWGANVGLRYNW
ncbi:MAG: autotransporter outer membrane beta-barrel domain-containing protein [Pseudomonas sp.]